MSRKVVTILLIAAVIITMSLFTGCRAARERQTFREFSDAFTVIKNKYDEKLKTVVTREQYVNFQTEKSRELEELLEQFDKRISLDEGELLKSKVLIELGKYDEAGEKIDRLIQKDTPISNETQLVQVQLLIHREQPGEALKVLRRIETGIQPGPELMSVFLYFALYADNAGVMEDYALKFLNSHEIPRELALHKAGVYRNLAVLSMLGKNFEGARASLKKAIESAPDEKMKSSLEAQVGQLELIGQNAPAIAPGTWLNGTPKVLAAYRGRVVVLNFWAPWCVSSRQILPALVRLDKQYDEKDVLFIGLSRLYGKYSDDTGNKGAVEKEEEIELIKAFLERHLIGFPIVVNDEGQDAENYGVGSVPTLVVMDKKGAVAHVQVGSGCETVLKDKINQLLEEK